MSGAGEFPTLGNKLWPIDLCRSLKHNNEDSSLDPFSCERHRVIGPNYGGQVWVLS